MAISIGGIGAVASSTTSTLSVAYPANQDKDTLLLFVTNKPQNVTPATPTGWTLVASNIVGTGTQGAGTGQVRLSVYKRYVSGTALTGNVSVSITSVNVSLGVIVGYRSPNGEITASVVGGTPPSDTTSGTGYAVTTASAVSAAVGDWLVAHTGTAGNVTATQAGWTPGNATTGPIGTIVERVDAGASTGNAIGNVIADGPILSALNATTTYSLTLSGASTGGTQIIKLVEPAPTVAATKAGAWSDDFETATASGGSRTGWGILPSPWVIGSGYLSSGTAGTSSTYASWFRTDRYDLQASSITWDILRRPAGTGQSSSQLVVSLGLDANNQIEVAHTGSDATTNEPYTEVRTRIGGTVTSNLGAHNPPAGTRYYRIREASGTLYFERSVDGTTWVQWHSLVAPFNIRDLDFELSMGRYDAAQSGSQDWRIGGINVIPAAAPALSNVPNPERGFFYYTETHEPVSGSTGRSALVQSTLETERTTNGRTVVFRYYVMERFLGTDTIDQAYKDFIAADIVAARNAGVKLIPRFTYSTSGVMTPPYNADPPRARVISHIQQLAPVLNAGADVIDALECGFIGMWGEWYYTDNYGDLGVVSAQQWADRKAVVDELLTQLDPRIFILIRYVNVMRRLIDGDPTNTAYATRMGHHNDAFLAEANDWGTYGEFPWNSYTTAQNRTWLANRNQTGWFPMGGETANPNSPRSDYPTASAEMLEYRWSFLNPQYHLTVLDSWGTAGKADAAARLGYRLTLGTVTLTPNANGTVTVSLPITNDGFARPYRNKPVKIDFVSGGTTVTRDLAVDIRTLAPNGATTTLSGSVTAPPTAGTYTVFARIVDQSASLQSNPLYSVRFANTGVFDATTGRNSLGSVTTTVGGTLALTATATLGGSGGLTTTMSPNKFRTATLTGSGQLTTTMRPNKFRTVALDGSGALSVAPRPNFFATPALSGQGDLLVGVRPGYSRGVTFDGVGTLTTTSSGIRPVEGLLFGTGQLTPGVLVPGQITAVSIVGQGSLVATPLSTVTALSASLSGSGSLVAAAATAIARAVALSGSGALTTLSRAGQRVAAALTGEGNLSTFTGAGGNIVVEMSGLGTITSLTRAARTITGALTGLGTLTSVQTPRIALMPTQLSGQGGLEVGVVIGLRGGHAVFIGTGSVVATHEGVGPPRPTALAWVWNGTAWIRTNLRAYNLRDLAGIATKPEVL
jgi:hypothetical protein